MTMDPKTCGRCGAVLGASEALGETCNECLDRRARASRAAALRRERERRAGCVALRRARATGTVVGVYRAAEAGLDTDGGAWVSVCEDHGTICNHATRAAAEWHAPAVDWCEPCQAALEAAGKPPSLPTGGRRLRHGRGSRPRRGEG